MAWNAFKLVLLNRKNEKIPHTVLAVNVVITASGILILVNKIKYYLTTNQLLCPLIFAMLGISTESFVKKFIGGNTMQIGKVIRTYRKKKDMTQEEMANRLGVTTPAVNKWENNVSQPDIGLLAPIARLLGISLDELLSFHEELSADEISNIIKELNAKLETEEYSEVFQWAESILQEYPNCNQLIWQVAVVLDAGRLVRTVENAGQYDEPINRYYQTVLEDEDPQIKKNAADSLFGFYLRKEEYDKAESYLQYFSQDDPVRQLRQATVYTHKGMEEEACKIYEKLLFSGYQILNQALSMLYLISMKKEDYERAKRYLDKQSEMARTFEMGKYNEMAGYLDFAAAQKDVAGTLRIVKELMSNIETIRSCTNSFLYEHLEYQPLEQSFYDNLKKKLLDSFKTDESLAYMKECDAWEHILQGEF